MKRFALAALALLLFAALPAGGQELTREQAARYEGWAKAGGILNQSDWRGQRWVTPPPCEPIREFRCWANEWLREFPSPLVCCDTGAIGYELSGPECTRISCRYPPPEGSSEPRVSDPEPLCRAGNRYLSAERTWHWGQRHVLETSRLGSIAAASPLLAPYVCGPRDVDVDPRIFRVGDEVRLSDALSSGSAPLPQEGCNLGGWSASPVERETCDEVWPASRMTGPGANECCHKDNPPSFFPPRPASRTCVERPQCFLGGEPPAEPVDPPVEPTPCPDGVWCEELTGDQVGRCSCVERDAMGPPPASCENLDARLAALESAEETRHAAILLELDALEATTWELHREALRVTLDRMLLLLGLLRQEIQAVPAQCKAVQ